MKRRLVGIFRPKYVDHRQSSLRGRRPKGRRRGKMSAWSARRSDAVAVGSFRLLPPLSTACHAGYLQRWSRIFRSEETEMDVSIWIPTEIFRIFGIMGSTLSQVGVPKDAATQARLRDSHNHLKKPDCETREIRTILNETRGFWKTNRTRGNRHCYLTFNMALVATLCTSWVFSFFSYTL